MSLLKCPECNNNVSEYAEKCQVCGCPIEIIKRVYNKNSIKYVVKMKPYPNSNKIKIVSRIMEITSLKVAQAKDIVDNCKIIKSNISLQEAEYIKKEVEALGGQVEITPYTKVQDTQINMSLPKCPTCHSTNIKKIGTGERVASVVGLGILSKKINKTWKCCNCGYTW